MRVLIAVLALSAGLYYFACAADKKDSPSKPTEQGEKLKALQKKFTEEFEGLLDKFKSATTAEEKNAVKTEAKELAVLTAEKVTKIAEEDPKSDAALDASVFALSRLVPLGASGANVDKLIGIVSEHHLNSPKVKDLVMMAGRMGSAGEKFLKDAAEKSTDKSVKGFALYSLGSTFAEQADDASDEKMAASLTAKAIEYLEKAAKEAPDVMIGRDTIAQAVKNDIAALKTLSVGSPAPDVEGTELSGTKVKLSSYKGKVVLLDIWATWCGPCKAMIPHERKLVEKLKGKPFELISVSADEKKDTLVKFLEKEQMPWKHWWAGEESDVLKTFRVKAFPTLYLIDAKGVIRKKWIGSPGDEVLDKAVEEVVKEAPSKG